MKFWKLFALLAVFALPANAMADYWVTSYCTAKHEIRNGQDVEWSSGDTKIVSEEVIGWYNDNTTCFRVTEVTTTGVEMNQVGPSRVEVFDDFTYETLATTGVGRGDWIVFSGSDGDATSAVVVAGVPEGQILMGSGGAGDVNDGSTMSLILLSQGALVSTGLTVFETRVSFDQITGTSWCFGLSDTLAEATERNLYKVNSGTIADGGLTLTNAVAFCFDTDATAPTKWQFTSENAGTIAGSAAEDAHTTGPTADTYATLRIEVDATGDARFYIDGTLVNTETTAVATTSLLIPFIGGNSADDADVATDVHVDYIYFAHERPSSDA